MPNPFPSPLRISGYPRGVYLSCLTQGDTAVHPLTGIRSGVVHWTLEDSTRPGRHEALKPVHVDEDEE